MPAAILPTEEQQQPIRELIAKAKDVSPVVKLGIEKLSTLPGASQVQKLSDPLVNAVDHSLVRVYAALPFSLPTLKHAANDQITTIKQHIPTQWLTRVDDILAKARTIDVQQVPATITTTTAEVKQSIQAFYTTSVDHFLVLAKAKLNVQLHVTSNNGHANGNGNGDDSHVVTREEFVAGLKAKLKHVWDDSLVAPAELFYERAKTLYVDHIGTKVNALTQSPPASPCSTTPATASSSYLSFLTSLRAKLDAEWEQKVVEGLYPSLKLRVSQPAKEVYASALAHYLKLQEQPRVVKATEFIQSYKQAIGQKWNDKLEQPLREIYGEWKQQRTADLQKLHAALDYDCNGYLTVSDFVDTSKSVVSAAQSSISNKWQSVLHTTINTFDSFIPAPEQQQQQEQELKAKAEADQTIEQTPVTVTGVATHVTQRLRDRTNSAYTTIRQRAATNVDYVKSTAQSRIVVARQFGADRYELVRQFSSQKLAPIIRVDLVNVAEDLLTKQVTAYHSVQSRIETANAQVQQRLETASARVKVSLEQLQHTLADVTAKAKSHLPVDAVQHHLSTANNQLQSYRNIVTNRVTSTVTSTVDTVQQQPSIIELQRRLRDSILHARALVSTSNDYVLHTRITQFPTDIFTLLQQSRTLVVAKSQETSREALTTVTNHLNDVIASVKELLHWKRLQDAEADGKNQDIPRVARFVVAAPKGEVVAPLVAAIEEKEAAAAAAAAVTSPVKSPMRGALPTPTAHLNMPAPAPITEVEASASAPAVAKKTPVKTKNGKKKA